MTKPTRPYRAFANHLRDLADLIDKGEMTPDSFMIDYTSVAVAIEQELDNVEAENSLKSCAHLLDLTINDLYPNISTYEELNEDLKMELIIMLLGAHNCSTSDAEAALISKNERFDTARNLVSKTHQHIVKNKLTVNQDVNVCRRYVEFVWKHLMKNDPVVTCRKLSDHDVSLTLAFLRGIRTLDDDLLSRVFDRDVSKLSKLYLKGHRGSSETTETEVAAMKNMIESMGHKLYRYECEFVNLAIDRKLEVLATLRATMTGLNEELLYKTLLTYDFDHETLTQLTDLHPPKSDYSLDRKLKEVGTEKLTFPEEPSVETDQSKVPVLTGKATVIDIITACDLISIGECVVVRGITFKKEVDDSGILMTDVANSVSIFPSDINDYLNDEYNNSPLNKVCYREL